ncbi:hypothetical protein GCM10029963_05030 [Micromonospora andamanensis]
MREHGELAWREWTVPIAQRGHRQFRVEDPFTQLDAPDGVEELARRNVARDQTRDLPAKARRTTGRVNDVASSMLRQPGMLATFSANATASLSSR